MTVIIIMTEVTDVSMSYRKIFLRLQIISRDTVKLGCTLY